MLRPQRQMLFASSKLSNSFPACVRGFCLLLLCFAPGIYTAHAQAIDAHLSVVSLEPARVRIEGKRAVVTRDWSFRNSYAGVVNLGERIENLSLTNDSGALVTVSKLASGEYRAKEPCARFSYEVRLDAPENVADAAYVSWISETRAVLMLNDLLPRLPEEKEANSAAVRFTLPLNWQIVSLESRTANDTFVVKDAARAVFFVGQNLRRREQRIGAMTFTLATTGEWAFTDEDAMRSIADVLREHIKTNGGVPRENAMLMLTAFPRAAGASRWSAETRGGTTLLLLGQAASRTAALAGLSLPLAHELFHLWIPNGVALDGNYDWFYEGFTQYQALRTCVRLGTLTFQEFLNAIGAAFDAYHQMIDRDRFSLVEASERRWMGAPGIIYHKGLLTAFLFDLTVREKTGGKRSLDDVYRELFRSYRRTKVRTDGNAAVIKTLSEGLETPFFARQYVTSASTIDLSSIIAPFGLKIEPGSVRARLAVVDSPTRKQRDLLRQLGYNNETHAKSPRVERKKEK